MRRRELLALAAAAGPAHSAPATVASVLGPVSGERLGIVLPHEHIAASEFSVSRRQRDSVRSVWKMLAPELRRHGIRRLVQRAPGLPGPDLRSHSGSSSGGWQWQCGDGCGANPRQHL